VSGSVWFWPEQISAVTDLVPEQQRLDRMITTPGRWNYVYMDHTALQIHTRIWHHLCASPGTLKTVTKHT